MYDVGGARSLVGPSFQCFPLCRFLTTHKLDPLSFLPNFDMLFSHGTLLSFPCGTRFLSCGAATIAFRSEVSGTLLLKLLPTHSIIFMLIFYDSDFSSSHSQFS